MLISDKVLATDSSMLKWLQYIVFSSVILYFGKDIFIPISFALLISFVLYPMCAWFERKGLGRIGSIIIAVLFLMLLGILVVALLIYQFVGFLDEWPSIQSKINEAITNIGAMVELAGFSKDDQRIVIAKMTDQSGANLFSLLANAISASTFSIVMLLLVPVYAVLILYYRQYWMKILGRIFSDEKKEGLREMIILTIKSYYNFIKGMAIVYIVVGSLNSVGLLLLGVPHAILFGFIASILTFIPYVGIIVGALLPMTMAWITYDSIWYPVGIVAIFTFVQ